MRAYTIQFVKILIHIRYLEALYHVLYGICIYFFYCACIGSINCSMNRMHSAPIDVLVIRLDIVLAIGRKVYYQFGFLLVCNRSQCEAQFFADELCVIFSSRIGEGEVLQVQQTIGADGGRVGKGGFLFNFTTTTNYMYTFQI